MWFHVTCCGDEYIVKGDGDVLLMWLLVADVFFEVLIHGREKISQVVDFCGIVAILNKQTCELHDFWVKVDFLAFKLKLNPNIWAKHIVEWVKRKIEHKICDMS